jgi:hypothetical protein
VGVAFFNIVPKLQYPRPKPIVAFKAAQVCEPDLSPRR